MLRPTWCWGERPIPFAAIRRTNASWISNGTSTPGITERLVAAGVVRDTLTFRAALWASGQARSLKAGEYRFDRPMSAREVIDKIARGDVYVVPITFREGLTVAETADVFASSGFGTAQPFFAAAKNVALIRDLNPEAADLDGYLFPDTYTLPRKTTAERLVERMVIQFKQAAGESWPRPRHGACRSASS